MTPGLVEGRFRREGKKAEGAGRRWDEEEERQKPNLYMQVGWYPHAGLWEVWIWNRNRNMRMVPGLVDGHFRREGQRAEEAGWRWIDEAECPKPNLYRLNRQDAQMKKKGRRHRHRTIPPVFAHAFPQPGRHPVCHWGRIHRNAQQVGLKLHNARYCGL